MSTQAHTAGPMDLTERVARAICGTDCKLGDIRGVSCNVGHPCQATPDQLFLSSIWPDAEAAIAAIAKAEAA